MPLRGTFGFQGRSGALVRFDFLRRVRYEIGSPGRNRTGTATFTRSNATVTTRREWKSVVLHVGAAPTFRVWRPAR